MKGPNKSRTGGVAHAREGNEQAGAAYQPDENDRATMMYFWSIVELCQGGSDNVIKALTLITCRPGPNLPVRATRIHSLDASVRQANLKTSETNPA